MVFQDPFSSLNPARKIGWILEEPLRLRGITDRDKRRQMVADMLVDVGLDRHLRTGGRGSCQAARDRESALEQRF